MKRALGLITTLLSAVCAASAPGVAQEPLNEQVRRAWEEGRQARFQTVDIKWTETVTTMKGTEDAGLPRTDETHAVKYRLICDGDKVRYTRRGMQWDGNLLRFIDKNYTSTFNDGERRKLYEDEKQGSHPAGFVSDAGIFNEPQNYHLQPVILTFRPTATPLGGFDLAQWRESSRRGTVGGQACRVIEYKLNDLVVQYLWLADSADFRVLRHEFTVSGRNKLQLTIEYDEDSRFGYVCSGWKHLKVTDGGAPAETIVAKVDDAIFNQPIEPATFELEFPPGTVVQNEGSGEMSIVREDGTWRPITPAELRTGTAYSEIMHSEAPPESRPSQSHSYAYLVAAAAIAVTLAWRYRLKWRFARSLK